MHRLGEVVGREGAGEAGRADGRQHVRRAGAVVADGRRSTSGPQNTAPAWRTSVDERLGAVAQQLEVLGGDGVGDGDGGLGRVDEDAECPTRRASPRSRPAGASRGEPATSASTAVGHDLVPRDQPGQAVGAVLGLHDDVDGGEGRRHGGVGDDDDLRRPGEGRRHADAALAGDLPLGHGDVDVAGPDDDVDGGDRLGAVGEGGDGLGAADRVHGVGAGDGGGGEHDVGHACRRDRAARTPTTRGDAGDLGRDDGHQHGRRVDGPAAGDVAAGPVDGPAQRAGGDAAGVVLDVAGAARPPGRPGSTAAAASRAPRSVGVEAAEGGVPLARGAPTAPAGGRRRSAR